METIEVPVELMEDRRLRRGDVVVWAWLRRLGAPRQGELARAVGQLSSVTGLALDRLERAGWAERVADQDQRVRRYGARGAPDAKSISPETTVVPPAVLPVRAGDRLLSAQLDRRLTASDCRVLGVLEATWGTALERQQSVSAMTGQSTEQVQASARRLARLGYLDDASAPIR